MKETACTFVWQSFFIFMPIYSIGIDSTTIMFIAMESVYYVFPDVISLVLSV